MAVLAIIIGIERKEKDEVNTMEIKIKGKGITLDCKEVEIAQKLVNSFLASIKDSAVSHGKLSMYLTTVAVMYITGADILREISPDAARVMLKTRKEENNG